MSARSVFLFLAGVLSAVVFITAWAVWRPAENPFVSFSGSVAAAEDSRGVSSASVSPQEGPIREGDHLVYQIAYSEKAFTPQILIIDRGDNVRFVNKSTLSMRMDITLNGSVPSTASYVQPGSVGKNGSYALSFSQPGVWIFKNMDGNPGNTGIIYVQ